MVLTAASSPAPSPTRTLHSGTEGAKAALVRIELSAAAEIAHIDHSTGEVEISRGRSTVPLGFATGVLTSADGIVATTWENLAINEDAVSVYAANELFGKVIGVPIIGNGGNPARRGSTPDPHWGPHLQHCYNQVTHCILFRVPQYHVRTYTTEPGGVMAELLNAPSKPHDVALLRISGGGGAPTATLAAPNTAPGANTLLLGFTKRPAPAAGPAEIPVKVDAAAGRISSPKDLAVPLNAGVSGGPVLDRTTGQVLGLAGPRRPDGSATLVPAAAIRAAMAKAGVEASPSKFDAVFRRGIDHLSSGNPGGSAESSLEESLTYYDSALATSYLKEARAMKNKQATDGPSAAAADAGTAGPPPAVLLPILVGVLLLAGIIGAIALRRRGASAAAQAGSGTPTPGASRPTAASAVAAPAVPANRSRASDDRPAQTTAARVGREQAGRDRSDPAWTDSARTKAAEHQSPSRQQSHAPAAPAVSAPEANPNANVNRGTDGGETRTAGSLAPRAADGEAPNFCSQCGRRVRPGARFCTGCGYPVG